MTDVTLAEAVPKRAEQLVVGDQVLEQCLPYRFNKGPAVVVFKVDEPGDVRHTFFAYRYPNGVHDGTTVQARAELQVIPATPVGHDYSRADDDPDATQPIAGRLPAHLEDARTGEVHMVGGPNPDQRLP